MIHLQLHGMGPAGSDIPVLEHEITEIRIRAASGVGGGFLGIAVSNRVAGGHTVANGGAEGSVVGGNLVQVVACDQAVHASSKIGDPEGGVKTKFALHGDIELIDTRGLQTER